MSNACANSTGRRAAASEKTCDALKEARAYIVLNAPDLGTPQCQHTLRVIDEALAAAKGRP